MTLPPKVGRKKLVLEQMKFLQSIVKGFFEISAARGKKEIRMGVSS